MPQTEPQAFTKATKPDSATEPKSKALGQHRESDAEFQQLTGVDPQNQALVMAWQRDHKLAPTGTVTSNELVLARKQLPRFVDRVQKTENGKLKTTLFWDVDGKKYECDSWNDILGSGAFGIAYRIVPSDGHGPPLVAKTLEAYAARDAPVENNRRDVVREATMAEEASRGALPDRSRTIPVKGVASTPDGKAPHLVLEYMQNGTLENLSVKIGKALEQGVLLERHAWGIVQYVARELALALQQLENVNMVHHDLKPANVLLNQRGQPVLADFGTAELAPSSSRAGTPEFQAPESVRGATHDGAVDLYSLGATAYKIVKQMSLAAHSITERQATVEFATNAKIQATATIAGTAPRPQDQVMADVKAVEAHVAADLQGRDTIDAAFKLFVDDLKADEARDRLGGPGLVNHPFLQGGMSEAEALSCIEVALAVKG